LGKLGRADTGDDEPSMNGEGPRRDGVDAVPCPTVEKVAPESAARATAAVLREQILAREDSDWFLGSEDDLLARLNVSRPTLRQAARILEYEQLLVVRRGLRGGLFARRPSSEPVAQAASVYLRSRDTTITELSEAGGALSAELARLAATHPSVTERAQLLAWVEAYQAKDRTDERRWFLPTTLEFGRRVAELSRNKPLVLFEDVLRELALAPFGVKVFASRSRIDQVRKHHRLLAEAVRDGEPDEAAALARRQTARTRRWLVEEERRDPGRTAGGNGRQSPAG